MAQNLLRRWHAVPGTQIDVWAINYSGWPHDLPYRLFPASESGNFADFRNPDRLSALCARITAGRYTAVWFLNDLFSFSRHNFPQLLRSACAEAGTQSFFYFPVDSDLEPSWLDILEAVDVPVSYTHFGIGKVVGELAARVRVLPHGVDTAVYYPLPDRARLRAELFEGGWVQPEDVLLLNVSQNQKRKDVSRSLALLARLRARGVQAKLLMHMPRMSNDGSTDLEAVSRQLGLVPGEFWAHTGGLWSCNTPKQGEDFLNALYNSADLLISTSLGEGWGLPITEALAAGCPVAVPEHTACEEIAAQANRLGMGEQVMLLELDRNPTVLPYDNSRVRFGVNVEAAACQIEKFGVPARACGGLSPGMRVWLSWDRLASEWMALFRAERTPRPTPAVEVVESQPPPIMFRAGTTDAATYERVVTENCYLLPERFEAGDLVIDEKVIRLLKLSCNGSEWPILYTSSRLKQVREIVGEYNESPAGFAGQSCRMATLKEFLVQRGFSVSYRSHVDGGQSGVFRAINQGEVGK